MYQQLLAALNAEVSGTAAKALVTKAEHQTRIQWDLVNLSRAHRGKPPIEPGHPFRPRDLIDPREEEGRG